MRRRWKRSVTHPAQSDDRYPHALFLLVPERSVRLTVAVIALVADVLNRADPGQEVQDLGVDCADVADPVPVAAGDDKDTTGLHLDGITRLAEELRQTAAQQDSHPDAGAVCWSRTDGIDITVTAPDQ